jgi:hypothetical protein
MITKDPACESRIIIHNDKYSLDAIDMSELENGYIQILFKEKKPFRIIFRGSLNELTETLDYYRLMHTPVDEKWERMLKEIYKE